MDNVQKQVDKIIDEINNITELLYQQKVLEGYAALNATLVKIMKIMEIIGGFSKGNKLAYDLEQLNLNLKTALGAMEKKDNVLLADILNYEIAEQLRNLVTK